MNTQQFQALIQKVTNRPLTLVCVADEIPLDYKITIMRGANLRAFEWKTPKSEDALLHSFITAFCSRYREPDPDTYDNWQTYALKWENPETRNTCAMWLHHATHMLSKAKLRAQVIANFSAFTAEDARIGFYPTLYGIGICTIYGGQWVRECLDLMHDHLKSCGVPYSNEMSEAGWVTRFLLKLDKPAHAAILKDL